MERVHFLVLAPTGFGRLIPVGFHTKKEFIEAHLGSEADAVLGCAFFQLLDALGCDIHRCTLVICITAEKRFKSKKSNKHKIYFYTYYVA